MRSFIAGLVGVALAGLPAFAHDQWANGEPIPSWVRASCCGPADAHVLSTGDYWIDRDGFHLKAVDMVVPLDKILPSQDGRVWAFYANTVGRNATVYCVFYSGSI